MCLISNTHRRANCPFSCVSTGTSSVHGVSISGKGQAGRQTLLYFTGSSCSGSGCFVVAIHRALEEGGINQVVSTAIREGEGTHSYLVC